MQRTILLYLDDMEATTGSATIVDKSEMNGTTTLVLDRTIFYPKGGGQQCDQGRISTDGFCLDVECTAFDGVRVLHTGPTPDHGSVEVGECVNVAIDAKRRALNSSLQSGGHVVLNAVRDAKIGVTPTKGFHHPNGSYVEFTKIETQREARELIEKLQGCVDALVARNVPIDCSIIDRSEVSKYCPSTPLVPENRPVRIVCIDGLCQPCGGTHLRSVGLLRGMKVTRVRVKKGKTRISYTVALSESAQVNE